MPNLNVCTGHAFGTGTSGELVIAGSNGNAWTLAGSISTGNGLNTDPANGLWTAPHGCYCAINDQSGASLSQALSTTPWPFPNVSVTIPNPSSVSKVRMVAWVQARMTVNMAAASFAYVNNICSFAGFAAGRTAYDNVANPTASTVNGVNASSWNVAHGYFNAGATATLSMTCQAAIFGAAAVTLTSWTVWVRYVAWLLDPTQAGGIS